MLIDQQPIVGMNERQLLKVRRKFGMLFQSAALFDSLTVAENISFVLRREGKLTLTEMSRKVDEALAMVDLSGTGDVKPAELSGGMRNGLDLPGRSFTNRRLFCMMNRRPGWIQWWPTASIG